MTFPKYPEYKDSGVEWLGEVPAHWGGLPLKVQFKVIGGSTPSPDEEYWDGKITWVTPADLSSLPSLEVGASARQITEKGLGSCGATLVPSGSLVLSTRAPIGSLAIASVPLCTNQGCKSLVPYKEKKSRFFAYLLKNSTEALNVRGKGTTFLELSGDELSSFKVTVPPQDEQAHVARFLDQETARIDALVEEQKRLIELLKEKRHAVVSHAVTKGLDPDVPMKDSGVEWLGEVPAHWEVVRVKHAAKLESGHTPNKEKAEYWDGDIPWVSLNDSKQLARSDYIGKTKYTISELGVANSSARLLPPRAVVFTRDATIGLSAITTKEMAVSQHLIAWVCRDDSVIPEYLLLVFYAMKEELDRYTFGATIKTIGMPDVRSLSMSLPPLSEQKTVVDYVFDKRDSLDGLIIEAQAASRLLVERRSALISAAVTGKIDVRGWQPPEGSTAFTEATQTEMV